MKRKEHVHVQKVEKMDHVWIENQDRQQLNHEKIKVSFKAMKIKNGISFQAHITETTLVSLRISSHFILA